MNVVFFDPHNVDTLLPLTYTRPLVELRVGGLTLSEKWSLHLGHQGSWIAQDYLQNLYPSKLTQDNWFISGDSLPNDILAQQLMALESGQGLRDDNGVIAWRGPEFSADLDPNGIIWVRLKKEVTRVCHTWDVFRLTPIEIVNDIELLNGSGTYAPLPEQVQCTNPDQVFIASDAILEHCTLNTTDGPIYIDQSVHIMEGALLRGPLFIGAHSVVKMGAKIYGGTAIGPHCKVGGEINNSVIMGYSNKSHDGFLGNSVLGYWCNIGADTNTSNLKNNYDPVRLWNYQNERFSPTGLEFCGLVMGDHSKCAINTMFNTGTVVGVSANVFGAGFPRNFIPSFSWGGAASMTTYALDKASQTAKRVVARRGMSWTQTDQSLFETVFERSAKWRRD